MKSRIGALILLALLSGQSGLASEATSPTPAQPEIPKAIALVQALANDEGKKLLVDSRGNTLYVFDVDQGQAGSACSSTCAEIWPPYLLKSEEATDLQAPLGRINRGNRMVQLTYNGRPVYTYAFDRTLVDDIGNGVGGVWHYIEVK